MTTSWKGVVIDGLTAFEALSRDGDLAKMAIYFVSELERELAANLAPNDVCLLAFPTTVVLPNGTTNALAVVLQDRLVVSWFYGKFRVKTGTLTVPRSEIASVTTGPGTTAQTRRATMLTVHGTRGTVEVALPLRRTDVVAEAVRSSLLNGVVAVPEEPQVQVGASGRPVPVEEAIQRWFAFRRGEIDSSAVGMGALELARWMTPPEKAYEAELVEWRKNLR